MLDDYGRNPEERKNWLKDSKKYWEQSYDRISNKISSLNKELLSLGWELRKTETNLDEIVLELGE